MDKQFVQEERIRAFEVFCEIRDGYRAALAALTLVTALPNADIQLAGLLKSRNLGLDAEDGLFEASARALLETAEAQRGKQFATIRASALVSVCGATEYLVKAVFVDQAAFDPAKAATKLAGSKLKLSVAEVLGGSPTDQWFVVADELLKQTGLTEPRAYQRVQMFLRTYALLPYGKEQQAGVDELLTGEAVQRFNEAFLLRNCIVHNGGRVSRLLAQQTGRTERDLIVIDRERSLVLMSDLSAFCQNLNSLSLLPL